MYVYRYVIIYHDFLPLPRRGSHVKSDNTHTQSSNIHSTIALMFSICALFTFYPNRIIKRHPTPFHVITTRAREGGPKEHWAKQNGRVKLIQLHMHQGSPLFPIFCTLLRSIHCHFSVAKGHLHTIHPA